MLRGMIIRSKCAVFCVLVWVFEVCVHQLTLVPAPSVRFVAAMSASTSEEKALQARLQKKALITGGGGLLGRQLVGELVNRGFAVESVSSRPWSKLHPYLQRLFKKLDVISHELDLEVDLRENDAQRLRTLLERGGFDLVVNLAADRGGVKYDGVPMKMSNSVLNTQLPACLADLAAELGVPVFLMSTEYVWTGRDNGPEGYPAVEVGKDSRFVGETGAAPYALQKVAAERLALQKRVSIKGGDSITVIRAPVLYGPMLSRLEDGTASSSINDYFGENSYRHDTWQRRYPTNAMDLAFVIGALASKRLGPKGLERIVYHYGAQESVSKFEFMRRFLEVAKLPVDALRAEDAGERPQEKRPPFDVRLDIDATRQELTAVDDWREPGHLGAKTIGEVWIPHFEEEIAAQQQTSNGPPRKRAKQENGISKSGSDLCSLLADHQDCESKAGDRSDHSEQHSSTDARAQG